MFKFIAELKQILNSKSSKKRKADQISAVRLPKFLAFFSRYSSTVVVASMWLGSISITAIATNRILISYFENVDLTVRILLASILSPFIFVLSFIALGGFWAQLAKVGIIEGKFPRRLDHPIYALRRIYGTAWTQLFYFKPLYSILLAIPALRTFMFRSYGLQGNLSFQIYPDTWIRDLPLLRIGRDAYISNRATIGTNLSLLDGTTLVGPLEIGEKALIGHLCAMAVGTKIDSGAEVETTSTIGVRVHINKNAKVKPAVRIYHATEIGSNSTVEVASVIGMRVKIGENIKIPFGSVIPNGAIIRTQEDADTYSAREKQKLNSLKENIFSLLKENLDDKQKD